jgi:hypothetical protein
VLPGVLNIAMAQYYFSFCLTRNDEATGYFNQGGPYEVLLRVSCLSLDLYNAFVWFLHFYKVFENEMHGKVYLLVAQFFYFFALTIMEQWIFFQHTQVDGKVSNL